MTAAQILLTRMDYAEECIRRAPVLAVRLSRAGYDCGEFLNAYSFALEGVGGFDVPRDAPHIRRRAKANRKRNRAARRARKVNRA